MSEWHKTSHKGSSKIINSTHSNKLHCVNRFDQLTCENVNERNDTDDQISEMPIMKCGFRNAGEFIAITIVWLKIWR